MKLYSQCRIAMTLWGLLALVGPYAAADDGLADAIKAGKTGIALRYRYEYVDQESFGKDASASTLRLRLNHETGSLHGWSGLVEFDYVSEVLLKDFNSGSGTSGPNRSQYPVVADPSGPDLNQLYAQYSWSEKGHARIGRQRILLDDQRFVGGVGWRQNEQTYDAVSFQHNGWRNASIFYGYVTNVARIFGSSVPAGGHEQDTHLLNVRIGLGEGFALTGYAYLIDNDDAPAFSTNTYGIRVAGGIEVGDGKLDILAEAATQSDAANAPASFDADYLRLQAGWAGDVLSVGLGFESLGSDNGQGFRTPLATLHAFNGWADQFLATPATGLDDRYLRLGLTMNKWSFAARYHDFEAELGSESYGSEIDVSAKRSLGARYSVLLKFAQFDADSANFEDVSKAWVMLSANF